MSEYPEFYFATPRSEVYALVRGGARRILEIGCGSGAFRSHFAGSVEYWGVEPEAAPAADAARSLSKVLHGTFDKCRSEIPTAYFDLVVCNDVIEHMTDHRAFLREIQEVMAPAAMIVGSVPNVRLLSNLARLLVQRDWRYLDSGVLDYTHLRFFTEKSLRRELELSGLRVEEVIGINPLGGKDAGLARLLKTAVSLIASLLMGRDTRFVQYAFRAKRGA